MPKRTLTSQLDEVLLPLGFRRKYMTWNRAVGPWVDSIRADVYLQRVSIAAGVLDPGVYEIVWGEKPPEIIDAVACTVNEYVGSLTGGKSDWWPLKEESTPQEMAQVMVSHVVPFLERMHSAAEMEKYIEETKYGAEIRGRRRFPDWRLLFALAILKHRRGASAEACDLLAEYRDYLAWRDMLRENIAKRIAELTTQLGCSVGE